MPRREVAALAVLGLLAVGGAGLAWIRARPLPPLPTAVVGAPSPTPTQAPGAVVHVVGAVARPGVYELGSGARVGDAVEMAGGPTRKADVAAINLARPLVDGEQIVVPEKGAQPDAAGSGQGQGAAGAGRASGGAGGDGGGKVNINLAGAAELETLPGIGPVLAERIVEHRESNGAFATVKDLMKVPGIGPKKYASIEPHITV